jgi:CHAD domain-containing protein
MLNCKKGLVIFLKDSRNGMVLDDDHTLSTFLEGKFHQNSQRVDKRLKIYLEDPNNEENVHDIRTSLRRLDTFYSLLPKKLRKRNRKQIEKYKDFFRANSKIRDLDIIRNKVAELANEAPDASKLDLQIQRKRRTELGKAVKLARALKKVPSMHVTGTPSSKIESRINKMIGRLSTSINGMLPLILSDDTKKEELHILRKKCKKMRYILEVLPKNHVKKYSNKVSGTIGSKDLKETQDMLGSIHDSDITIEYLQKSRLKLARQLVVKEAGRRDHLYREFVKYIEG